MKPGCSINKQMNWKNRCCHEHYHFVRIILYRLLRLRLVMRASESSQQFFLRLYDGLCGGGLSLLPVVSGCLGMQLNRCPVCHSRIALEQLAQDEAGRELLGLLVKLDIETGTALVGYLGLFRSASRDLANDKALKLAREVLQLGNTAQVAYAMRQTVETLQGRQSKPLSNHNYLKRILEHTDIPHEIATIERSEPRERTVTSKTALAIAALEPKL